MSGAPGVRVSGFFERTMAVVKSALGSLLLASTATLGSAELAQAQQRPADFTELSLEELLKLDVASLNVLGIHTHFAGQWMLSYKFMFERMEGNRDGTKRLGDGDVLQNFEVSPTDMDMEMHMAMVMYAPTDDLTLMGMLAYIRKSMDHVTRDGVRFPERSEGIGDLNVNALYTVYRYKRDRHRLILNAGMSFPTGSIDEKDFGPDPAAGRARLEYPMQLGSGTFDLLPGMTYIGQSNNWTWGGSVITTLRFGRNGHDYRLGNRYQLSTWAARKLTDWLSLSAQIDGQTWGNIHGADPGLDPKDEPTKDPNAQGGRRVDLLFGVNLYVPTGAVTGHAFAIQGGFPIYQSLDGPQLEVDWRLTVGWQWVF